MKERVRIAFIGAGDMANRVHYPSLKEIQGAEIAAICDLDTRRLHTTADKYEVEKRYTDYKAMLEEVAPDAVYIIMPPLVLFPVVMHTLNAGCNVFIEKPPAVTRFQMKNMALAAERKNLLTMVGFNRRFIPVLADAKKIVEERGPVMHTIATFYKNSVGHGPSQGGAMDLLTYDGIHAVDTLRWMAGAEVKEVVGDVRSLYTDYENAFSALVRFDGGCLGILTTCWAFGTRVHTFEMHGKGISAFVDGNSEARIYADQSVVYTAKGSGGIVRPAATVLNADEVAGSSEFYKSYGYYGENEHFIQCLKEGKEPQTNFADALKTMELVDRIYHSQRWLPS
ncbi:MAG: Gfo/Idh/MocA family oxidoreductase [Anaerolineae bacterium]|nr:Gfo/Idh/MocA family oxidoreductase [Anaerolineae bacterium]